MREATVGTAVARADEPVRAADHFQDLDQQKHAAQLGMWIFLASEMLLFAALFTLYAAYRGRFPEAFAEGSRHTTLWIGTVGTVVLLVASFLVALSIHAMRENRREHAEWLLWGAALLGVGFLALKLLEYAQHAREGLLPGPYLHNEAFNGPGAAAFFNLYYLLTGAHALHVVGGVSLLGLVAWRIRRGRYDAAYHVPHELAGMYWHLVDVVWLFLWPFFYLLR